MIVVTGAAGFISSCLVGELNKQGFEDIVIVDDFTVKSKERNWEGKKTVNKIQRDSFFPWLNDNAEQIQFIFHLGARTNTAEQDQELLNELNLEYSKKIWNTCCEYAIPLVYASSAATYGGGENGFEDKESNLEDLQPLNLYGKSKNDFDIWALQQEKKPLFWAGLKFFNVFGPNEYHKGRMASVVFHSFNQIKETNAMKLFRSHNPEFKDGEQLRDFVYVKDVVNVLMFLMHHRKNSGIYNLGTGQARTFLDLTNAVFNALELKPDISFIDTPEDIRDKYQYYTCASMQKLKDIGYDTPFYRLEDAVKDYVVNYLKPGLYY